MWRKEHIVKALSTTSVSSSASVCAVFIWMFSYAEALASTAPKFSQKTLEAGAERDEMAGVFFIF